MKIGVLGLAFLIMLVGKLAGWFAISWWIVVAPLLVGTLISLVFLVIFLIAAWSHL